MNIVPFLVEPAVADFGQVTCPEPELRQQQARRGAADGVRDRGLVGDSPLAAEEIGDRVHDRGVGAAVRWRPGWGSWSACRRRCSITRCARTVDTVRRCLV